MAREENSTVGADPVILKGSSYTLTSAHLTTTELAAIATFMVAKVEQAPAFFTDVPVVIDLEDVASRPLDLAGLLKVLRSHSMVPIGIRGGSDEAQQAAADIGLARFKASPSRAAASPALASASTPAAAPEAEAAEPAPAPALAPADPEPPAEAAPQTVAEAPEPTPEPSAEASAESTADAVPQAAPGKLVTQPVRGGQQLYAPGGDLVLVAGVNQGAEVLADGNVHVYGPLRGRALAGARGNRDARIFTTCLDAELLSIAGTYRVIDNDLPDQLRGKPAQIFLEGDSLRIEPLN